MALKTLGCLSVLHYLAGVRVALRFSWPDLHKRTIKRRSGLPSVVGSCHRRMVQTEVVQNRPSPATARQATADVAIEHHPRTPRRHRAWMITATSASEVICWGSLRPSAVMDSAWGPDQSSKRTSAMMTSAATSMS